VDLNQQVGDMLVAAAEKNMASPKSRNEPPVAIGGTWTYNGLPRFNDGGGRMRNKQFGFHRTQIKQ
jgi:hypothetical protein